MENKKIRYLRIQKQDATDFADALGAIAYTCDQHIAYYISKLRDALGGRSGDWVEEDPIPVPRGEGDAPCDLEDEGQVLVHMLAELRDFFRDREDENLEWFERKVRSLAIEAGKPLPSIYVEPKKDTYHG